MHSEGAHRWLPFFLIFGVAVLLGGFRLRDSWAVNAKNLVLVSSAASISGPIAGMGCETDSRATAPILVGASPGVLRHQGHAARLAGDCEGALTAWDAVLEVYPSDWLALYNVGMIAFAHGNIEVAADRFREAGAELLLRSLTRAATARGDQSARRVWLAASWQVSLDVDTVAELADLEATFGGADAASAVWQTWYDRLPLDDPDRGRAEGEMAALAQDWPSATTAFEQRLSDGEVDYALLVRASRVFELSGEVERALNTAEQAAALVPQLGHAYWRLVEILTAPGSQDLVAARAWAERSLGLLPTDWRSPYYVGMVLCLQGDTRNGQQRLFDAARLALGNEDAQRMITNGFATCK